MKHLEHALSYIFWGLLIPIKFANPGATSIGQADAGTDFGGIKRLAQFACRLGHDELRRPTQMGLRVR
jgi:hypothetical protein